MALEELADEHLKWVADAACLTSSTLRAELEGFNGVVVSDEALALCELCPVRVECLEHTYGFDGSVEFGYFGGLSPTDRGRLGSAEAAVEFLISEGRLPQSARHRVARSA